MDYDLITIGAGSGGVRASRLAAEFGAKVALCEGARIGGTCVLRGCIPKKILAYASHFASDFEDARAFGWEVGAATFDWNVLRAAKDKEVARLSDAYRARLEKAGVTLFQSRAVLRGAHEVFLEAEGRVITAKTILLAMGARPVVPEGIAGALFGFTSDDLFDLPKLPMRVVIVGAGYIALEFAGIFHGLGAEVHLLYRGGTLLSGFDEDIGKALEEALPLQGITLHPHANLLAIHAHGEAYRCALDSGAVIETDCVHFATGRAPNTEGLGLEEAGVALGDRGRVVVDAEGRTSVPNIYAVGDVTDRVSLTPVAIREGARFAEKLFGQERTAPWTLVPTAVFSDPPVGTCGHTEAEIRQRGIPCDVYLTRFRPLKHAITGRKVFMTMKLLVDRTTDRVLGCHLVGPDAPEMIQLVAVAMQMGVTKRVLDTTLPVHPTAAEELVMMTEKTRTLG